MRAWLLALYRFELLLQGEAGKERNRYLRAAAEAYENGGGQPGYLSETHRRQLTTLLTGHYERVIPHFAAAALRQVKSRRFETKAAQGLFQALVAEWVAREALRKAKLVADTDRDDVADAIDRGLRDGLGTAEIARNIRKVSQLTAHRAATVARTETHAAATFGSVESVRAAERDLGVRMLKEWMPTLDDRTRQEHRAMASRPPIALDAKFDVGGDLMDRPGDGSASPANVINCRCALAYTEATD